MTMEEYNHCNKLSTLQSPSLVPIPSLSTSGSSLISCLTSPPSSSISFSPTMTTWLNLTNCSWYELVMTDLSYLLPLNLLMYPFLIALLLPLLSAFSVMVEANIEKIALTTSALIVISPPLDTYVSSSCLTIQCDFCSQWEHSAQFCPTRQCGLCDQGGYIADNCLFTLLSPNQAACIFGKSSNSR